LPQYNFKTSDQDVIDYLKSVDNKSRVIVSALKEKRLNNIKPVETKPLKFVEIRNKKRLKVLVI